MPWVRIESQNEENRAMVKTELVAGLTVYDHGEDYEDYDRSTRYSTNIHLVGGGEVEVDKPLDEVAEILCIEEDSTIYQDR